MQWQLNFFKILKFQQNTIKASANYHLKAKKWSTAEAYLRLSLENSLLNKNGEAELEEPSEKNTSIRTLSSARCAQNLALFLKSKGECILKGKLYIKGIETGELFAESKRLYTEALMVRESFLWDSHPDTIATKFSLAEFMSCLGDDKGAEKLRTEIMVSVETK